MAAFCFFFGSPNIPLHHFQSPDQTNVTSDTKTPNINTKGHLEKIERAGTGRGPIKKKRKRNDAKKTDRTQPFIFTSAQRCEVVHIGLFKSSVMPPTPLPTSTRLPACLSWLLFRNSFYEKVKGLCVLVRACLCVFLQKMSTGFQAPHKKSRITKDLHICQRFGAEWATRRGGGALLHFQKFKNSTLGFFGTGSASLRQRADES